MAWRACKQCGQQVSTVATVCPHCGKKLGVGTEVGCLIAICIFIFVGIVGALFEEKKSTPEQESTPARQPEPRAVRGTSLSVGDNAIAYADLEEMAVDDEAYDKTRVCGTNNVDNVIAMAVQHRLLNCDGGKGTRSDYLRFSLVILDIGEAEHACGSDRTWAKVRITGILRAHNGDGMRAASFADEDHVGSPNDCWKNAGEPPNMYHEHVNSIGSVGYIDKDRLYPVDAQGYDPRFKTPSAPLLSAGSATPKIFPPLHIATSGRLPTSLHTFKLGMDFSDAARLNQGLQNFPTGGRASLNAQDEALVYEKGSDSISMLVTFTHGRAIEIEAEINGISPDDAEVVENGTFRQLGAADLEIDERGRSYPSGRWVWVDGDVRVCYESHTKTNGVRDLSLRLIDYPVFLDGLQASRGDEKQTQLLVQQTKQDWGAEPKPDPYASKPLPHGIEGLELGGSPLQVSAVFPSADMNSTPGETYDGKYRLTNGNEIRFGFFHNRLMRICEDRLDIPPEGFEEFRKGFTDQFGQPTGSSFMGATGWANEKVVLSYFTNDSETQQGHRPFMVVCIEDRGLLWAQEQDSATVPNYETCPASHSFFLSADLPTRQ